jgi:hypothetical protein
MTPYRQVPICLLNVLPPSSMDSTISRQLEKKNHEIITSSSDYGVLHILQHNARECVNDGRKQKYSDEINHDISWGISGHSQLFSEKRAVYDIRRKNIVQLDTPQMTIQRKCIERGTPKTTNTHSDCVILVFHCNNGQANAPQYYVIRALPVLLLHTITEKHKTRPSGSPDD